MTEIYVPAPGKRIVMPGSQADWPEEGQAINPIDPYQARLVKDGDLVLKQAEAEKPAAKGAK
jgi:hypothetical protein